MICVDTTVIIDEFRAAGNFRAPVNRALLAHAGESLVIPAAVCGEFLVGASMVSRDRVQEALRLLRTRRIIPADLHVAEHFGHIVSLLRKAKSIGGRSQNDLWIAATARSLGARLLTRNPADFRGIEDLDVIAYGR